MLVFLPFSHVSRTMGNSRCCGITLSFSVAVDVSLFPLIIPRLWLTAGVHLNKKLTILALKPWRPRTSFLLWSCRPVWHARVFGTTLAFRLRVIIAWPVRFSLCGAAWSAPSPPKAEGWYIRFKSNQIAQALQLYAEVPLEVLCRKTSPVYLGVFGMRPHAQSHKEVAEAHPHTEVGGLHPVRNRMHVLVECAWPNGGMSLRTQ